MADINSTHNYHRYTSIDLMKEYTIGESLSKLSSPYMVALETPKTYGAMVGDFLVEKGLLKKGSTILEIGGGYGSLMHGLLQSHIDLIKKIYILDLSKDLIKKQKKTLYQWKDMVGFIQGDIHELMAAIKQVDLIIINEVIGDLDTITNLDPGALPDDIRSLIQVYGFDIPAEKSFNLNIGAIRLVEALSNKSIPVFITEHSCDPIIPPDMDYLAAGLGLDSFPREIRLYNHCEYTIRFSHLIRIAKFHGKNILTGPLIDLIGIKKTPAMKFIFTSKACATQEQEIIHEFLDHIREYRWLVIN